MTKTKDKESATENGLEAMTATMLAANPAMLNGLMDVITESARFVTDRFRQDLDLQMSMLNCKSPEELLQLQAEFYQKAVEQYADEANRMVEMMTTATKHTVEEATSAHKRGYDDIPL